MCICCVYQFYMYECLKMTIYLNQKKIMKIRKAYFFNISICIFHNNVYYESFI